MARLPQVGGDDGTWGDILNDYLAQAHKSDGTIKDNAVTSNALAPNSVTNAAIASDAVNAASIADGSITEVLLHTDVQTKLNATGDWDTLSNKPAVIGAGADQAAARAAIGDPLFIDVAAAPYSVTPATTNPEVGIQQAIDDASANGVPEVIISKPGTYTVDLHVIPGQSYYAAAIWCVSNVKLTMKPGVIIKLKNSATLPGGASAAYIIGGDSASLKTNWSVEGGVIDGNATNQSATTILAGVALNRCRSSHVKNVTAKNVYGTASGPPGETLHFEATNCRDVSFIGCEADGSGSANTATGFSANDSFGVSWTDCVSHEMGFGMGFTVWQCAGTKYANCHAYLNGYAGFNAEVSEGIVYSSCISGSRSPLIGNGASENPYFSGGQIALGNLYGFAIHGCTDVTASACVATYNGTNLHIYTQAAGIDPAKVNTRVLITGCDLRQGTNANVSIEKLADGGGAQDQVEVHVLDCLGGLNTDIDWIYNNSLAPIIEYVTGTSGLRYYTKNSVGWGFRWIPNLFNGPLAGGAILGLNVIGQLATSGRLLWRRETAVDTTITSFDEIIAVTDTTAARTITLPSAATAGAGATYTIVDDSGGAGAHHIILTRAGSDLIEGQMTRHIATNYGILRVVSTGAAWKVLSETANASSVGINWYPSGYTSGNYYACNSTAAVGSSNALTNNSLRVSRWVVTAPISVTKLWIEHTAAGETGSVFRVGVYADDGTGKPGSLVVDGGTVPTDGAAAVQEVTVSVTLQPGIYWVGGAVQGAPTTQPTMRTVSPNLIENVIPYGTSLPAVSTVRASWLHASVTGALPSTFTPGASGTPPARIGFKVA